jgi:Ni/Fe-hydrogenase 1 B-type cytochrome subunit
MQPTPPTVQHTPPADTHDYSAPLRLWHWGNALLVSGQLLTILFLLVIVKPKALTPDFQQALRKSGGMLSADQGRALAHVISERIWDWHITIGLALAAFWAYWLVVQLTTPPERRFTTRLAAAARRYRLAPPAEHADARHALLAKLSYAAFYLFLAVLVTTGLALTWADDVAWLGNMEHTVKEVHNVTMYLIIAFVVVHIVGVVWAELTGDHGLISQMIGGKPKKIS